MLATAVIDKKRDGEVLTRDEIEFMLRGLVDGTVPDYQVAAWAMAVLCRGMTNQETADLTDCMLASGTRLDRATERPRVDKHSTGGLGDKTSLILAPLLACFEVDVPMLSGRGLGITGGTLDKLESYAGYRCDLTQPEIAAQLQQIGCVITGTTPDIAPADRKLYALRDVTGTVPSVPLITGSIMSKKLAGTLDALVLDVKCGSGAFMRTLEEAKELAESLCRTGARMNLPTTAVLTDMNQPLGRMVGNACEANESVEVLKGGGPADVRELTLRLCAELLVSIKKFDTLGPATEKLTEALSDGSALQRYQRMIEAQGGKFTESLPLEKSHACESTQAGFVHQIDGRSIGRAVIELGGGRRRQGEALNHAVGLEMLVRVGDKVENNSPLVNIFCNNRNSRDAAESLIQQAFIIKSEPREPLPLYLV